MVLASDFTPGPRHYRYRRDAGGAAPPRAPTSSNTATLSGASPNVNSVTHCGGRRSSAQRRPYRASGETFTDPHWIYPGWTLELPLTSRPRACHGVTKPARPRRKRPRLPPRPRLRPCRRLPHPPKLHIQPLSRRRHLDLATRSVQNGHVPHPAEHTQPVRLPSGSIVAGSFAAGVLSAVAIGRLRRRHGYHYRPPRPGRDLSPKPRPPDAAPPARRGNRPARPCRNPRQRAVPCRTLR